MFFSQICSAYSPLTTHIANDVEKFANSSYSFSSFLSSRVECIWITPCLILDGVGNLCIGVVKGVYSLARNIFIQPLALFGCPRNLLSLEYWSFSEVIIHLGKGMTSLPLAIINIAFTILSPTLSLSMLRTFGHARYPSSPIHPEHDVVTSITDKRRQLVLNEIASKTKLPMISKPSDRLKRAYSYIEKIHQNLKEVAPLFANFSICQSTLKSAFRAVELICKTDADPKQVLNAIKILAKQDELRDHKGQRIFSATLSKSVDYFSKCLDDVDQLKSVYVEILAKLLETLFIHTQKKIEAYQNAHRHDFSAEQLEQVKKIEEHFRQALKDAKEVVILYQNVKLPIFSIARKVEKTTSKQVEIPLHQLVRSNVEKGSHIFSLDLRKVKPKVLAHNWLSHLYRGVTFPVRFVGSFVHDSSKSEGRPEAVKKMEAALESCVDQELFRDLLLELFSVKTSPEIKKWVEFARPLSSVTKDGVELHFNEFERLRLEKTRDERKILMAIRSFIVRSEAFKRYIQDCRIKGLPGRRDESIRDVYKRLNINSLSLKFSRELIFNLRNLLSKNSKYRYEEDFSVVLEQLLAYRSSIE